MGSYGYFQTKLYFGYCLEARSGRCFLASCLEMIVVIFFSWDSGFTFGSTVGNPNKQ